MSDVSVLAEADGLINGDRRHDYGHALDNFGRIVTMWNAHLRMRTFRLTDEELVQAVRSGTYLTEEDIGWLMADVKRCREEQRPQRDNKVDAAGYIGLIEHVEDERAERALDRAGFPPVQVADPPNGWSVP